VRAAPPEAFGWLEGRTGCVLTRCARAVMAVDASGRIRGMVAYDSWTETAAFAHMAVDSPSVWRALLRPALEYAFVQLGRRLLLGTILASNARSMAFVEAVGFREVHRVRGGWAEGVDLVLWQLRREDWETRRLQCRCLKEAA
jgi:L-amino acid N-acyltransferase YncA